jgi:cytochrome c553
MRATVAWSAAAVAALCSVIAFQARTPVLAAAEGDPIAVPERLADTGLYAAGSAGSIDPRNRAFTPQYPLWSDGLVKKRWVYLPPGTAIDASNEHEWEFPAGTRFWKEFSRDGRRIETRMLWKASDARWVAVSYAWNEEGTEAVLAAEEGVPGVAEVTPGRQHSIPSRTDCAACHGTARVQPLGFNALQLSTDRDPNAIHGEPLRPDLLTLQTLVDEGRLAHARADLLANPPRIRSNDPATRAALGYLAANCGTCHNGRGEIAALGPIIRYRELLEDGDAVARSLVGQPTRWQLPRQPHGPTVLVSPGAPDESALIARMRSRAPSSQMPPLGTVVRDQEAVDAMARWIEGRAVLYASRPAGK